MLRPMNLTVGRLLASDFQLSVNVTQGFTLRRWVTGPGSRIPEEESNGMYSADTETHFGFETVSEKEKAHKVHAVFENVAKTYDIMNDTMSAGTHRIWKDIFIHRLRPGDSTKLIDVAGGTGDIAFRFLKYSKLAAKHDFSLPIQSFPIPISKEFADFKGRPENEVEALQEAAQQKHAQDEPQTSNRSVLVCDINPKMLDVGQQRSKSILTANQQNQIDWLESDAENLATIPNNTFDFYTIAFGIRNCVHIDKVLSEAYRVLRPGGRFMCLEFSHVENEVLKWIYDQYSFQVIPVMGQVIAGDWDSYQYLVESIRKFPKQDKFNELIEDAGFRFVKYENLTFGITAIHSGVKI